mgnify:CR=1 FL=1
MKSIINPKIIPITNFIAKILTNVIIGTDSEINIGTIIKNTTIQGTNTFTENIKEMLDDTKIPYPNVDEIPLIKIKDENYFENDKSIEKYVKSLVEFDDNKFNICRYCKEGENKFCLQL